MRASASVFGSSAIITGTMRALMQFYNVQIPKHILPTLVLATEREELNINAGLQDRVIQSYEGIVYMDFERGHLEKNGYGIYEELKPAKLPPLYVAYDPARAEISDVPHRNLRELYNRGDPTVLAAMQKYRELTDQGRAALMGGDWGALGAVMNAANEIAVDAFLGDRIGFLDIPRVIEETLNAAPNARLVQAKPVTPGSSTAPFGSFGSYLTTTSAPALYFWTILTAGVDQLSWIRSPNRARDPTNSWSLTL